jgi:hypothetical protein
MSIKMLDDLVIEYGDEETIKAYFEYCEKADKAARQPPFIICSKEIAKILNEIQTKDSK